MLQRLLAERFGLVAHSETRELPVHDLTMARVDGRLGPRMTASKTDCERRMDAYRRGEAPMPPTSECGGSREPGRLWMRGASMATLARSILTGWTDRIVEDRTGLTGDSIWISSSRRMRAARPVRPQLEGTARRCSRRSKSSSA